MKAYPMTQIKLFSVLDICKKCVRFQRHKHCNKKKKNKEGYRHVHPVANEPRGYQENESFGQSLSTKPLGFNNMISQRRAQAYRSVFVKSKDVQGTMADLIKHGKVNTAFVTNHGGDGSFHGLLAEYSTEGGVENLKGKTSFFKEGGSFPAQTRLLFHLNRLYGSRKQHFPLTREDMLRPVESVKYTPMSSLDEELKLLCERKSLNDIDLRKRFLVCIILEEMLQSVLPDSRVIPFGSCLNGFGWWSSDLDMMVCPHREEKGHGKQGRDTFFYLSHKFNTERELAQKTLAMVSSLVELTPQTGRVHQILTAKVPIISFKQRTLELDCDISFEAKDKMHMTQLLYLMSAADPRVRPLFTGIKEWAIVKKLTSGGVEKKTTTLGFIHLMVFYLQSVEPPVLPTLREMQGIDDLDVQIDFLNFRLPSSPASLPISRNTQSIESLLHGFFFLYSTFDFKCNAISIIEGATFRKPANSSPLHVQNPLSMTLNICQNVAQGPLDHIQKLMGETADRMTNLSTHHQDIHRNQVVSHFDILLNSRDMFDDCKKTDGSVKIDEYSEESIQKLFMEDGCYIADNEH